MKKNFVRVFGILSVVAVSAIAGGLTAYRVSSNSLSSGNSGDEFAQAFNNGENISLISSRQGGNGNIDLTYAADKSVHAVVHIKSIEHSRTEYVNTMPDIFDFFFGDGSGTQRKVQTQPRIGVGSGVIISEDGYIVTNNHVVDGADELDVTLNDKRQYKGRIIGTDPTTDVALIKIEADSLPFLTFANSDNIKVGEWVLAVGNPFNLSSTVTAGIVSAKARNLGMGARPQGSIESFIQTDAAVNQGNSGGALVDADGELIGINTAIYSPTGVYSGYGFAIPTNLVKAVVVDLKKYGTVQRAQLGIMGGDNNADLAKEKDLSVYKGVYISQVVDGGAADKAGIKAGDVIVGIDNKPINSMAELQEAVALSKPGAKMTLKVVREKKEKTIEVTLQKNKEVSGIGDTKTGNILGAKFEKAGKGVKQSMGISSGLVVKELGSGKLKEAGVREGFVILKANDVAIGSEKDLESVVEQASKSDDKVVFIVGAYPSGRKVYYAIDLR